MSQCLTRFSETGQNTWISSLTVCLLNCRFHVLLNSLMYISIEQHGTIREIIHTGIAGLRCCECASYANGDSVVTLIARIILQELQELCM